MDENKKLLLLEQKFEDYKEATNRQMLDLKQITQSQEKRIVELEAINRTTDLRFEQIMNTLKKLNDETIPDLIQQVEELKNKPVKRYDQAISGIIGAIFGAVGCAIASIFIK